MTDDELKAIRARADAATPGPWEAGTAMCCPDMGWVDGPRGAVCPVHEGAKRTHTIDSVDAEFIAHAREDVPALCDEVERLRAEWRIEHELHSATLAKLESAETEVERLRAEVERVNRLHSEAEGRVECRNEMRAEIARLRAALLDAAQALLDARPYVDGDYVETLDQNRRRAFEAAGARG